MDAMRAFLSQVLASLAADELPRGSSAFHTNTYPPPLPLVGPSPATGGYAGVRSRMAPTAPSPRSRLTLNGQAARPCPTH